MSEPLLVLIVDDDALNRMVMERMVEALGCTVHTRGDGFAALDACRTHDYDLVIIDVRMPGMDGLEASRRIRASRSSGSRPAVIGLTAFTDDETVRRARESGVEELIEKPIESDHLREICERISARRDDRSGGTRDAVLSG